MAEILALAPSKNTESQNLGTTEATAMGYTFRVIFEGVCAYIPDTPFFVRDSAVALRAAKRKRPNRRTAVQPEAPLQPGNPQNVQILLPDLRNMRKAPDLVIPPHFATLRAHVGDLTTGTDRNYQLVYRQAGAREEIALYNLEADDLSFDVARATNRTSFTFGAWVPKAGAPLEPRPDLRDQDQVQSLVWLPRLREIAPDFGPIRQELIGPNLARELAARISASGGFLRMLGFNLQSNGVTPRIWRFAAPSEISGDGTWNRAIGNRLALEFFQVEGPVRVRLANQAQSSVSYIACAPPIGSGRDVEIVISNVEPESLFAQAAPAEDFDPDFDAMYSLFQPPKDPKTALRRVPNPRGRNPLGAIEKPCSGGTS